MFKLRRKLPCMVALRVRRGGGVVLEVDEDEAERAILVKRSEMDFSRWRGGRIMWTSGSGQRGS